MTDEIQNKYRSRQEKARIHNKVSRKKTGRQEKMNKTIQKIREEIRGRLKADFPLENLPENPPEEIKVLLPPGIYDAEDFVFTGEDCSEKTRIIYDGGGKVSIRNGMTFSKDQWEKPDAVMASRFEKGVREKIRMIDLSVYGLARKDWGDMQAIGAFETSAMYTMDPSGLKDSMNLSDLKDSMDSSAEGVKKANCEVYCKNSCGVDQRMIIARYPNEGYLKLEAVADVGDVAEFPPQNYYKDWYQRRNQRGGTYIIDRKTNEHIRKWADSSDAWMFGYFFWDWADSSTPVTTDPVNRRVFPQYVSQFGARKGGRYYFYNVPEELDTPGEWYLDRKEAKLYFFPWEGAQEIQFCFRSNPILTGKNVKNLTFRNLTLEYATGDAVQCTGDGIIFENLRIQNIGGTGIVCTGTENVVKNCEISRTGKGGVCMEGGCRKSLTSGKNRVTNCYIHNFSEEYQTCQPGIFLKGVGNRCDHNEIANAPHAAVMYEGNEQIIEYNDIHDVVLMSGDAGAIYAGYNWAAHGCIVRYNRLERIGSGGFRPNGIYWDDGLSGQTAYGNLLIDVKKDGFLIGGGRENVVKGNVLVHCGIPIVYDDRNREGFVQDGWARAAVNTPDAPHWKKLGEVPYDTEPVWLKKYPRLSRIKKDFAAYNDPDFPINPAYSIVEDNVIIHSGGKTGEIADSVFNYSKIGNNLVYCSETEAGYDIKCSKFLPQSPVFRELPSFTNLPVEQMGRF